MSYSYSGSSKEGDVNRIYVGNLPTSATQSDIEDLFQRFGRIVRCDVKRTVSGAPFAFLEYEDPRDARDAIESRDGYNFDGCRLRVEVPFNARPEGGGGYRSRPGARGGGQRGKYRALVSGLPSTGSWQDLKDHMRKAGECGHADVFGDGTGIIEFFRRGDLEAAIKLFDSSTFSSHEGDKSVITVREDTNFSGNGDRGGSAEYHSRPSPTPVRGGDYYRRGRGSRSPPSRGRDRYDRRYEGRAAREARPVGEGYRGESRQEPRDYHRAGGDYGGRYNGSSASPLSYRGRRSHSRGRPGRSRSYGRRDRSRSRDRR